MTHTIDPIKLISLFAIGYLHFLQHFQLAFLMEGASLDEPYNAWVAEAIFSQLLGIFNL